jgi:hypothetical protein
MPTSTLHLPFVSEGHELPVRVFKDIIDWDVRSWSHCLKFWAPMLKGFRPELNRVLTFGERHGGISLWFALQGYHVICSDLPGHIRQAKELHEQYGVADLITYADVNVFSIPYDDGAFEIAACKSVIGGLKLDRQDSSSRTLQSQSRAVAEIHRVIKPGGAFLGAENLNGTIFHRIFRTGVKRGRIGWRHLSIQEIIQLFEPFELVEQRAYGFFGSRFTSFGLDRLTAAMDRCLCPFLPERWQYISFIRAKKRECSRSAF